MTDGRETFGVQGTSWPGLAKLLEECGEVIQVLGKLMVAPDMDHTWAQPDGTTRGSGDLSGPLHEELGDLRAAIDFFIYHNDAVDFYTIQDRSNQKYATFCRWYDEGILDGR